MAAYCETLIPCDINRFYIDNCQDVSHVVKAKALFNIFTPFDVSNTLTAKKLKSKKFEAPEKNIEVIEFLIQEGFEIAKYYIRAGFLDGERFIQDDIPSWALNMENTICKLIILQNGFLPIIPDFGTSTLDMITSGKTTQEKFNESSLYRQQITRALCLTIYHYLKTYKGKILPPLDSLQLYKNFLDLETFELMMQNL
jgi:hypothetical protein